MTETALSRKKIQNGWAMYDWANSVYNLVIGTAIFPIFYGAVSAQKNAEGVITGHKVMFFGGQYENTELLSYCIAFALACVCVLVPLFSGVADYFGRKKTFMQIYCYLGAAASASLYFFDIHHLELSMLSVILASVGFWCSYAMYNSFLPIVATEEEQDKLSAKGFSLGYAGSVILLLGNLIAIMVFKMSPRWSFVSVAIWWAGFAQITFSRLHEERKHSQVNAGIFSQGFRELLGVWKELKHTKQLKSYLLAFFVFSMGIQTIMQMASFFGEKEIQLKSDQLIIAILLVQLIAIPGAYVFSFGSKRLGNIPMLQLALLIWAAICYFAFAFVNDVVTFFIAASLIGFIMGGTQSLARSTYSKLIPGRKDTASFFSFYDVTEKVGLIIGLISFGFIEGKFSMRYSILALIVFFVVGFVLMFFVPKNKQEG